MVEKSVEEQLQALQDRACLIDLACKYAIYIDRRRWEDLARCFADEIELNTIRTGRWARMTRLELISVMQRAFESYTATQHVSANHQVTIDGDCAVVWSTLNATHYLKGAVGGEFHQQVGYYEYEFVRDGDWRISKIQQFAHWQRGNQEIFDRTLQ
jgi:hypothetical protein